MTHQLQSAIENHDIQLVEKLLKEGVNPDESLKLLLLKIENNIEDSESIEVIKLLLRYGADTGFTNADGRTALGIAIFANRLDIASLLLEYGAISTVNRLHPFTLFSVLDQAIIHSGLDMVKLLLDYGADTCIQSDVNTVLGEVDDFSEYIWTNDNNAFAITYTKETCDILNNLLDQNNPPYLKLGEGEENKYIIYENRVIEGEINPYILSDFKNYKDKKYLYSSYEISLFLYWAFQNNLLCFTFFNVVNKLQISYSNLSFKNLENLILNTMVNQFTIDAFNKEGKLFVSAYLTVTHWWYNYFHDLKKLYPTNKTLIELPDNENTFENVFKLLDIRLAQYQSGKHFNPNQSKNIDPIPASH